MGFKQGIKRCFKGGYLDGPQAGQDAKAVAKGLDYPALCRTGQVDQVGVAGIGWHRLSFLRQVRHGAILSALARPLGRSAMRGFRATG